MVVWWAVTVFVVNIGAAGETLDEPRPQPSRVGLSVSRSRSLRGTRATQTSLRLSPCPSLLGSGRPPAATLRGSRAPAAASRARRGLAGLEFRPANCRSPPPARSAGTPEPALPDSSRSHLGVTCVDGITSRRSHRSVNAAPLSNREINRAGQSLRGNRRRQRTRAV